MRALPLALAASVCRYGWAARPVVWRAAEEVDDLPVGAQITLTGRSAARCEQLMSSERIHRFLGAISCQVGETLWDTEREGFAVATLAPHPIHNEIDVVVAVICMLHNQRLSYETAVDMAARLGRILVAHDGLQWVPFRELFSLSQLRKCYGRVVELDHFLDVTRQTSTLCIPVPVQDVGNVSRIKSSASFHNFVAALSCGVEFFGWVVTELQLTNLAEVCGFEVLDQHVTVPFETIWMRSETKAPWNNGTRLEMRWAGPEEPTAHVFGSKSEETWTR
eukprot:Skav216469  [mRNA]  locus=scaffold1123:104215:106693:+ [translate_table: standard]